MKTFKNIITILLLLCPLLLFAQDNATPPAATPAPIPEEARRHFVMGMALFKDAKTTEDFSSAIGKFKQAADLAPQWPEARYNLALAHEAAGDLSGAIVDLKQYLRFKLSETEARTVQDKIYVMEAKAEKMAKKRTEEQKAKNRNDELNALNGERWRWHHPNCNVEIVCSSNTFTATRYWTAPAFKGQVEREWEFTFEERPLGKSFTHQSKQKSGDDFTIAVSEDGQKITTRFITGWDTIPRVFIRE